MIGVVHASKAIDAIQRFMGKIELGMIPHVIDTIIFVRAGKVERVYELAMIVKVPSGMVEADLARPVVEVKDFESGVLEYEIYTFGEENIVIPVTTTRPSAAKRLAAERIMDEIAKFDPRAEIEITNGNNARVRVDNRVIARLIGKDGATIKKLQERLGIHLDVEPKVAALGKEIKYDFRESGNTIELKFRKNLVGKSTNIYIEDNFLFSAIVGKKGKIKVTKRSDIGKELVKALVGNKKIKVMI